MTAPGPATKLPWVLFGLLSLGSLAGPFAIFLVVRGGRSPGWPPDRPLEWWTFGLIIAAETILLLACLSIRR